MEKIKLTKIGNSQGFRISKKIMEKAHLSMNDEKELILNDSGELVIRNIKKAREGWRDQFINAGSLQDNQLLIPDVFEDETFDDWTW